MEHSRTHRQQQGRGQELRHVIKITACGSMIGTAVLFPLANVEGLWFRAVTLSIFILSVLGFHALHIEPFVKYGPFTAAAALVFLLLAVLAAGSSRRDLIPWLPLFIASLSLMTIAIYKVARHGGPRHLSIAAEHEFSGVSIDTLSNRSDRTISTQPRPRAVLEPDRHTSLYLNLCGPSSMVSSHRTGTDATEISLSSVEGQCRSEWDELTRGYFPKNSSPARYPAQEPLAGSISPGHDSASNPASELDLSSDPGSVELTRPLLGPQGAPMP